MYPGETAIVVLTPDNIRCSAITDTKCTATIPGDDTYTVNLTLTMILALQILSLSHLTVSRFSEFTNEAYVYTSGKIISMK